MLGLVANNVGRLGVWLNPKLPDMSADFSLLRDSDI
jgi:hypothetical protein